MGTRTCSSLVLAMLLCVCLAGLGRSFEDGRVDATISDVDEDSQVDEDATSALAEIYRNHGWRKHRNGKCSYKYKKSTHCPDHHHKAEHKPEYKPEKEPEYKDDKEPEYKEDNEPEYKPKYEPGHQPEYESDYKSTHSPDHSPDYKADYHDKPDYKPSCPPPPPEEPYCCARSCPTPVPKPPSFDQLPSLPTPARGPPAADGSPEQLQALRDVIAKSKPINIYPTLSKADSTPTDDRGFCSQGPRVPVTLPGPPPAQGAVKLFITTRLAALPANCGFNVDTSQPQTGACSGNTLSTGLVLAAAHCFDANVARLSLRARLSREQGYPTDINNDPCGINTLGVQLVGVMACYDFDQTTSQNSFDQSKCLPGRTYMANGASWYPRPALTAANPPTLAAANELIVTAPYDQAVLFMATPINHLPPAAYFKYNYRNNYPNNTPVNVENWSYIGFCSPGPVDNINPPCPNPPGVACPLSHVGPSTLNPPTTLGDTPGPAAINTPITSFPGNSGSCLLNSPDQCCYAVSSFGTTICSPDCNSNRYSPIMAERPLSTLWASRQVVLAAP